MLLLRRSGEQRDQAARRFDDLASDLRRADRRIVAIRRVVTNPLAIVYGAAALLILYRRAPRVPIQRLGRAAGMLATGWQLGRTLGLVPGLIGHDRQRAERAGENPA
jgi:hypothetical protein